VSHGALHCDVGLRRGGFALNVALDLPEAGITALVGPSGSGKTTLLRAIAGLERPQQGRITHGEAIWFDAEQRIDRPTRQRRVGYMFQEYALFGHLTVAGNVGFGLPRRERPGRVAEWLKRMHIGELQERRPHQLSGGQRQRVALARALAPEPAVLLLDEPLSAVDATLRQSLRTELRAQLAAVRRPVLLVTHDLDDVRRLADRVGVVVGGRLHALGEREALFRNPVTAAAAQVLGWPNVLPVAHCEGNRAAGSWGELTLTEPAPEGTRWVGIRPERLRLTTDAEPALLARVVAVTDLGALREVECRLPDDTPLLVHLPAGAAVAPPGSAVGLTVAPEGVVALRHEPPPSGHAGEKRW